MILYIPVLVLAQLHDVESAKRRSLQRDPHQLFWAARSPFFFSLLCNRERRLLEGPEAFEPYVLLLHLVRGFTPPCLVSLVGHGCCFQAPSLGWSCCSVIAIQYFGSDARSGRYPTGTLQLEGLDRPYCFVIMLVVGLGILESNKVWTVPSFLFFSLRADANIISGLVPCCRAFCFDFLILILRTHYQLSKAKNQAPFLSEPKQPHRLGVWGSALIEPWCDPHPHPSIDFIGQVSSKSLIESGSEIYAYETLLRLKTVAGKYHEILKSFFIVQKRLLFCIRVNEFLCTRPLRGSYYDPRSLSGPAALPVISRIFHESIRYIPFQGRANRQLWIRKPPF